VPKKVILFDFDGTIAPTIAVGVSVFNELAREHGFLEITPKNAVDLRKKGPWQVMQALHIPKMKVPLVVARLRKGVQLKIGALAVGEDMRKVLLTLKQKGYGLGIVTSSSKANVLEFLKKNQLEIFDYIEAGSGLFFKARAIKKVIARHHLQKTDIAFVGDEIRDVAAARKNNITAVAVVWGANSREGLASEHPDFIADTPPALATILSRVSRGEHHVVANAVDR